MTATETAEATTELIVIGPNLMIPDSPDFHVHAKGCADIARNPAYRGHRPDEYDVDSLREVVESVYPPDEFDYDPATDEYDSYLASFQVFACVHLPAEPATVPPGPGWLDDPSQFPRLLAEILMAGLIDDMEASPNWQHLLASMDLRTEDVEAIFAAAETAFEADKDAIFTGLAEARRTATWEPEPGGTITPYPAVNRVYAFEHMPTEVRTAIEKVQGLDDETLVHAVRRNAKERGYVTRLVGELVQPPPMSGWLTPLDPAWLLGVCATEAYDRGLITAEQLDWITRA
jgi:hypothetical protein